MNNNNQQFPKRLQDRSQPPALEIPDEPHVPTRLEHVFSQSTFYNTRPGKLVTRFFGWTDLPEKQNKPRTSHISEQIHGESSSSSSGISHNLHYQYLSRSQYQSEPQALLKRRQNMIEHKNLMHSLHDFIEPLVVAYLNVYILQAQQMLHHNSVIYNDINLYSPSGHPSRFHNSESRETPYFSTQLVNRTQPVKRSIKKPRLTLPAPTAMQRQHTQYPQYQVTTHTQSQQAETSSQSNRTARPSLISQATNLPTYSSSYSQTPPPSQTSSQLPLSSQFSIPDDHFQSSIRDNVRNGLYEPSQPSKPAGRSKPIPIPLSQSQLESLNLNNSYLTAKEIYDQMRQDKTKIKPSSNNQGNSSSKPSNPDHSYNPNNYSNPSSFYDPNDYYS